MWMLITLLWRITSRLLRRLGRGALLVPVAAVGMVVLGVTVWTVAAVAVAAVLAIRRPSAAGGLLPVALICAGLWGLALAAAGPGMVAWTAMPSYSVQVLAPQSRFTMQPLSGKAAPPRAPVRAPAGKAAPSRAPVRAPAGKAAPPRAPVQAPAGQTVTYRAVGSAGPAGKTVTYSESVQAPGGRIVTYRAVGSAGPAGQKTIVNWRVPPPSPKMALHIVPGKPGGPGNWIGGPGEPGARLSPFPGNMTTPGMPGRFPVLFGRPQPRAGFMRSWLLVPLALLMLTVGLWLMPQSLARLRQRAGPLVPYLRHRAREIGWGLALAPATAIGMSVFGVSPWTVAAVTAAVVITIWWPKAAADLVPFVLVALALRGFQLAVHWQSLSAGMNGPGVPYGLVTVDGRQSALAAGAEASAFLAFGAWLVPRTIGTRMGRFGSGADADLAGRVARLTESRGHAVDAAAAELRRIERDLHDGAQARLVALGMNLRAVERVLPTSPQAALALIGEARETSVRALSELRDLIRGICPPVLADRGLGHAVQALVLDTPLPTALEVDLPGRPAAPVESACYFAVAEALANAVKHSGARHAGIRIQHAEGMLRIEVADDGVGGADPAQGTGLQGVERRLGTFDGIMAVSSPPGGPTMIVMEVPCALLSPKTCSC
jgi:signal transduction histidine kinase